MLLAVCSEPQLLEAVLLAKKFIQFLEIAAPVGVIIFASIDIIKAVTSKDQDSIKKATSMIPKRLLAMAILFFVPLCVDMTMSIADNEFEYSACFTNATDEKIETLYINIADIKIASVDEIINSSDWKSSDAKYALEDAKNAILKINDENKRASYDLKINEQKIKIEDKEHEEEIKSLEKPFLFLRDNAYAAPDQSNGTAGNGLTGGGTIPFYNQCDPRWNSKGITYYGGSFCYTACGATSLAMVVSGLTGDKSITPITISNKMHSVGLAATYASHAAFTSSKLLGSWGIKGTAITTGSSKSATKKAFDQALSAGKPIIANIPGHYIVIDSMNNGQYHVLDPARPTKFNKYWTWDAFWQDVIINYIGRNSPRYAYWYYEKA